MKAEIYFLAVALAVSSANAGLIGFWNHDELSGPLLDSTNGHVPGTPTGTPTYGQPGVPNGVYDAITVTGASGTAIEYGPSTVDEFFTIGSDNINPVMNLDAAGAFTIMGWVNPIQPALTARTYRFLSTGSAAGADRGWGFGLRLPTVDGVGASVRFTTFGIADNDSSTFNVKLASEHGFTSQQPITTGRSIISLMEPPSTQTQASLATIQLMRGSSWVDASVEATSIK